MTDNVMMACGHAANAVDSTGAPTCVICIGISPGADTVAESPNLEGREMVCSYSGLRKKGDVVKRGGGKYKANHNPQPSKLSAAFFAHNPDADYDGFYCGCWGWD